MKFLIIGIGNVGLRHIQGLTNLSEKNLEFYLLDKNDFYKTRFDQEIKELKKYHILNQINKIDEIKNIEFELTIISTTATNRTELLSTVIKEIKTKFILIEKPICQSESELENLKKITTNNVFVNFPRRYCEWHKKIRKKLLSGKFNRFVKVEISGGLIGLACNACHFIDLLNSWTNKYPIKINTDGLADWYASKRDGFYEIDGNMKIYFDSDLFLELNSYNYKKNIEVNVYDNENKIILSINYDKGSAKFLDGEIINGKLKYQSENTHNLLKLIQGNNNEICSLNSAINSYDILIKELISNWNNKFKTNEKKIMIT